MSTLSIRLPEKLKSSLEQLSKREHVDVSDIVRESLRRYIAVHKFRLLRSKVLPFAQAQGFLTDEDVFKKLK